MTVWVFAMTVWCASSRVSRSLANVAICSSPFTLAISPHRSSRNFGTHLLPLSLFPIFMLFTKSFIPALYSCLFQLYFPVAAQDDSFSNQSGLRAPSLVCNIVFYRYLAPVCRQAGPRGNPFILLAHTNTRISLFLKFSLSPLLIIPSSCSSQNHLSLLYIHASSNYIFPLRRRTIPFSNQSGLRAPSLVRNIVFYRYLAPTGQSFQSSRAH